MAATLDAARWVAGSLMSATTATFDSLDITSGANDIIVIRQENGDLQSSPFNVRFGKAKVIRPSNKNVSVSVNGERVEGVALKLGPSGEAFWVMSAPKEIPAEARCSPLSLPVAQPDAKPRETPLSANARTDPANRKPAFESAVDDNSEVAVTSPTGAADSTRRPPTEMMTPLNYPPSPEASVRVDPITDLTEEELMDAIDPGPQMMDDDEADKAVLKYASPKLMELNERLHGHSAFDEPVSESIPVPQQEREELRLAESAEDNKNVFLGPEEEEEAARQDAEDGTGLPRTNTASREVNLGLWTRYFDKEQDRIVYCNVRTLECTHERPDDYVSDGELEPQSTFHDGDGLSSDSGEYVEPAEVCAKTLYPTKEQLKKLGLIDGRNEVSFHVTSLSWEQTITCSAYLWDVNCQLVVSDVDGTITRSDILGHLLPRVGRDWTHKGICSLYQRIADNGYKLIYLSSRSISQIHSTRDYISSLQQDKHKLPLAPLLVAPDRIFAAFTREVVNRTPHEFKCRMLHAVKLAFPPGTEPFYAGFGNRINDAWAYASVGIKEHKVFLIDPNSLIHVFDKRVRFRAYGSLDQLTDQAFPPLKSKGSAVPCEFNAWNFWCLSPSMGHDDDDASDHDASLSLSTTTKSKSGTGARASKPPGLVAAWGTDPTALPLVELLDTLKLSSPPKQSSVPSPKSSPTSARKEGKSSPREDPESKPVARSRSLSKEKDERSRLNSSQTGSQVGSLAEEGAASFSSPSIAPQSASVSSWNFSSIFGRSRSPPAPSAEKGLDSKMTTTRTSTPPPLKRPNSNAEPLKPGVSPSPSKVAVAKK
ncbi:Phosphatidate phosphatase PAH2 [Diplonema papillatum]|nr:Phosphatidate phosphatase PAH2 [Diplonema papillatum]